MSEENKNSAPFKAMAERIERNLPNEFGGAFVVVGPKGELVSYAAFDPNPLPGSFWALVKAAVDTAVQEFQITEQRNDALRARR